MSQRPMAHVRMPPAGPLCVIAGPLCVIAGPLCVIAKRDVEGVPVRAAPAIKPRRVRLADIPGRAAFPGDELNATNKTATGVSKRVA